MCDDIAHLAAVAIGAWFYTAKRTISAGLVANAVNHTAALHTVVCMKVGLALSLGKRWPACGPRRRQ